MNYSPLGKAKKETATTTNKVQGRKQIHDTMNEKEGQVGFKDDSRKKEFGDFEIAIKLSEKNKVC